MLARLCKNTGSKSRTLNRRISLRETRRDLSTLNQATISTRIKSPARSLYDSLIVAIPKEC